MHAILALFFLPHREMILIAVNNKDNNKEGLM